MKLMHGRHGLFHNHHNNHNNNNHDHNPDNSNSSNNNRLTGMSVDTSNTQTTSSNPLGSSSTSGSYTDLLKSMNNSDKNNSNKNLFGSSQDLMNYTLQTRNHNLTNQLVQSKKDWETLQKTFRSTTHGLFVYQTTLARIVNHVQDFHDPNDIQSRHLLDDLIQWTSECEHLTSSCNTIKKESSSSGIDESMSKTSTTSNNDGSEEGGNGKTSLKNNNKNRTPIIDYNDVQPFVDTSTIPTRNSFWMSHHQSLQEQNDMLQIEISKWKSSMSRIRLCNVKQQIELKCHQETLSKVVNRIQQTSSFQHHQKEIMKWYNQCIQEAERYSWTTSSSFSSSIEEEEKQPVDTKPCNPKDAYCKRCHSKLSTSTADSDQECIENDDNDHDHDKEENQDVETKRKAPSPPMMVVTAVAGKSIASGIMTEPQRSDTPPTTICTVTSTSIDEQQQEEEEPVKRVIPKKIDYDVNYNDITLKTEVSVENDSLMAANVEDPPDTLRPTATNLKESSLIQVHPTTGCADTNADMTYNHQQHSGGCGNCCIM